MKLFIPTPSLNADNILSCECIAPATACRHRHFGYTRYETLPELRHFDNYSLAFTAIPDFSINDTARENFPMLVEIEVDNPSSINMSLVGTVQDVQVYATSTAIPITPGNTRLLFFKREHLDYTHHNCADSAKCKLFEFFKERMSVIERGQAQFTLSSLGELTLPASAPSFSENDYDRAKGFLWGYALGAILSKSPEVASLVKIQKRIYDIVSSSRNDGHMRQPLQQEITDLDKEYSLSDSSAIRAREMWNEHLMGFARSFRCEGDTDFPKKLNDVLIALGVETPAKTKFMADKRITLRRPLREYHGNYEQYSSDLQRHTQDILRQRRNEALSTNLFSALDVDTVEFKSVMLAYDDEKSRLYNLILNHVLWNGSIPSLEDIRINRADVATSVVKAIKAIIEQSGNQWHGSDIQDYYDRMRKNISLFEPFALTANDSSVHQSVAAFLLKGDDFESLKSYLEMNAVDEFRYSLALWGALTGYVSIPRALMEIQLSHSELAEVYNLVTRVLHNVEVSIVPPEAHVDQRTIGDTSTEPSLTFHQSVRDYFDQHIREGKTRHTKKDLQRLAGLEAALTAIGDNSDGFNFVSILNEYDGWSNATNAWKAMKSRFAPDYDNRIRTTRCAPTQIAPSRPRYHQKEINFDGDGLRTEQSQHQSEYSSIRIQHTGKPLFVDDPAAVELISHIMSIPTDTQRLLLENLRYIQQGYRPGGRYNKDLINNPRDNVSVIAHFIRMCRSKKNPYLINDTRENSAILERVKKLLIAHYCD